MTIETPDNDRHNWVGAIFTIDRKPFHVADPKAAEVDIDVIAHALSLQCRFMGHVPTFYSVAEHSVRVARWLAEREEPVEVCLQGLLHDATEAYCGDMVRPMKLMEKLGGAYLEVEESIARAISEAEDIDIFNLPQIVKDADKAMFDWETENIRTGHEPGWPWEYAKVEFLVEYQLLRDAMPD